MMISHRRQLTECILRIVLAAALAAGLTADFVACGGPSKTRRLDRLYRGLSESLPQIDPSVLKGRRIVIDPGHGGHFRGTVGRDSLEESSVNLGVSLYLWGLLREAGADVYLTRAIDRDFLTGEDSTLASDLRARVAMVDSLVPDVLISIHHNAQPERDPSRNLVETYYRAGDPASLDLAFAVHRHLMRNLGIERGEVRQGNYLILRESTSPAVLGESSYLTHPPVEEKLKLSNTQKLEAEAYFLGILEYFERGIPRIRCISPSDSSYEEVPALVYALEDDGGSGIDPDGVTLLLNGRPVAPVIAGAASTGVSFLPPWDLPNGSYEATLTARNIGGNTSPVNARHFTVDFPPALAAFDAVPKALPPAGGVVLLRARLLDRRGLAIADGTEVEATTVGREDTVRAAVAGGRIDWSTRVAAGTETMSIALLCRGQRFETTLKTAGNTESSTQAFFLRDELTGLPVTEASIFASGDSIPVTGSPTGTYLHTSPQPRQVDPTDSLEVVVTIVAPGYRPYVRDATGLGRSTVDTLEMTPWFDGALHGLRFVLDPEGGPPSRSGIGSLGLSGSYANLQVSRYLAGYLRAAGSRVLLIRTNEEVRTPEDVARMTNRFRANRYIEIRHRSADPENGLVVKTLHFPGSKSGGLMAESVLDIMSRRLDRPAQGPTETVTYPLQQTACPAIVVEAPAISTLDEELRLAESWYQREQAYSIFVGILDHYGVTDSGVVEVTLGGSTVVNWTVTVDNAWTLVTGHSGRVVFEALPLGKHVVRAVNRHYRFSRSVEIETDGRARVYFDTSDK
jgi:N-acetylmuramoyl-L-alanine amidase